MRLSLVSCDEQKGYKTTLDEVADQPACISAHNTVTKAFDRTLEALETQALAGRFDEAFSSLRTGHHALIGFGPFLTIM